MIEGDLIDVEAIRNHYGLTKERFCLRFGFNKPTLQNWETGESQPRGPARSLLIVMAKEPDAVCRALDLPKPTKMIIR